MEDKRLATLFPSKEVPDRMPHETVDLPLRLPSRVEEPEIRLNKHSGDSGRPPSSDGPFRNRDEWNAFYARLMRLFKMHQKRKDDAGALVRHMMRKPDSLWTFPRESGIAAANNPAERLLRFTVIWRKRGFGTRTRQGDGFVERLLSFRQTRRLREKRTYPRLAEAFGHYLSGSKPAALFSDARGSCRSVTSARSLLSLSKTLHTYRYENSLGGLPPGLLVVFRVERLETILSATGSVTPCKRLLRRYIHKNTMTM
jgi:hypothetical protein